MGRRGVVGGYSMLRTNAGRKPVHVIRTRLFPTALQWLGGGVADDSFLLKRRLRLFPALCLAVVKDTPTSSESAKRAPLVPGLPLLALEA